MNTKQDLAGLVIALSAALRRVAPDNTLPKQAMGYLQDNGLSTPLRKSIDDCTPAEWDAASKAVREEKGVTLCNHIARQMAWSQKTFGPGKRTKGLIAHIRKELDEIAQDPEDITEWIDVVILALDGAWRNTGATPAQIAHALTQKQLTNESRTWPDWRTLTEDDPVEHDRSQDEAATHGR